MEKKYDKFDKFFHDKCPCSKTGMQVFKQGHLSRTIYASVDDMTSALCQGIAKALCSS